MQNPIWLVYRRAWQYLAESWFVFARFSNCSYRSIPDKKFCSIAMVKVNRSLDSTVTFLGFKGIYLLLLVLWSLVALGILILCLNYNVPTILMMLIETGSTVAVVFQLARASKGGNILEKKVCSKSLNYYICKR